MAQLTFNFIDVGQGDGTFIIFPDGTKMLIDLGSLKNSKIIKPEYLAFFDNYWTQGGKKNKLDTLILTHGDQDHYNLIEGLFSSYDLDVTKIYITGQTGDYYVNGFDDDFLAPWAKKGRLHQFGDNSSTGTNAWATVGGVKIYLLQANYPDINAVSTNDKSAVLLFEYKGNKMIMGGDATKKTEKEIVRYYTKDLKNAAFLRSSFMKVNHHGSETSSCKEWIEAVNPRYVFISADMHDSYLLPRCPVINRIVADGNIDPKWEQHPFVCYDGAQDDWRNFDTQKGIFSSLAKYTVATIKVKDKKTNKIRKVDEVTGHGVRFSLNFKDDGKVTIDNTDYPSLLLSAPDRGHGGL